MGYAVTCVPAGSALAGAIRQARPCAGERAPRQVRVGALLVDLDELKAWWAGQVLPLTALEFNLLAHLASEPERGLDP